MTVPGIPLGPTYAVTAQGTADPDTFHTWRPFHNIKRYTNAFVWDPTSKKILLGYKKRGFGKGMYNGFGGKVDPGETVLAAGVRELKEEAGIDAPLEPCGLLFFVGEGESFAHHISVFRATTYTGTITESDEMRPEWFAFPPLDSIPPSLSHPSSTSTPNESTLESALPEFPYSKMWKDDPLWIPHLLSNTPFVARVDYGPVVSGKEIDSGMQRWWVATVEEQAFREAKVWEV